MYIVSRGNYWKKFSPLVYLCVSWCDIVSACMLYIPCANRGHGFVYHAFSFYIRYIFGANNKWFSVHKMFGKYLQNRSFLKKYQLNVLHRAIVHFNFAYMLYINCNIVSMYIDISYMVLALRTCYLCLLLYIIQLCSGITRGRALCNGELYAQIFQTLIYLHLFTECFMMISPQSSEQIQTDN